MGLTVLSIDVANPAAPRVAERVEFLIDSGTIYSVVPRRILKKLKIKPLVKETFRLANGTKIVRQKGMAIFRYGKRVGGSDVIFGEQGDHALLGALTLEALGLSLDPLKRELKPLPLMLAAVPSNEPGMKSACKIDVGRPPQGRPIFPICSNFRRFETSARILPSD